MGNCIARHDGCLSQSQQATLADIDTVLVIGVSLSFFLSATPENVPDNLFEKGQVFRIVQDAISLVFGARLLLCHKNKKEFAIKTRRAGKSITVINLFLRDRFRLTFRLYIRTRPQERTFLSAQSEIASQSGTTVVPAGCCRLVCYDGCTQIRP